MSYDLTITESFEPLIEYTKNIDKPIILWGHAATGKSAFIEDLAKHLGYNKKKLYCTDFIVRDGNPIWNKHIYESIFKSDTSVLIEFEFANKDKDIIAVVNKVIDEFASATFFEKNRLILCAHPFSEKVSLELLGPELQQISKNYYDGRLSTYIAYPFQGQVLAEVSEIAVLPSVDRWLSWAKNRVHELVFTYIEKIYTSDAMAGYRALYSFLFAKSLFSGVSPRGWHDLSKMIVDDTKVKLLFQGEYKNFNSAIAAFKDEWILKDEEFTLSEGQECKGLKNILNSIEDEEDFETFQKMEIETFFRYDPLVSDLLSDKYNFGVDFRIHMLEYLKEMGMVPP